ncbi:unnamed protein product [Musa banksii]
MQHQKDPKLLTLCIIVTCTKSCEASKECLWLVVLWTYSFYRTTLQKKLWCGESLNFS